MTTRQQTFNTRWRARLPLWLALVCCVNLIIPSVQATAQETAQAEAPPNWQFRFDLLQLMFRQLNVTPLAPNASLQGVDPPQTVLVVLGAPPGRSWSEVEQFVRRGGSVLVATDRGLRDWSGVALSAGPATARDNDDRYQGFADCPRVTDLSTTHPFTIGVNQLVLNRTGWLAGLSPRWGDWAIAGWLPDRMQPASASNQPVVASVEFRRNANSRLALLADHSVLANGMLWHGDNAIFAMNVTRWLCQPARQSVIFWSAEDAFALGAPELPAPSQLPLPEQLPELSPRQWIAFANHALAGIEDANLPNELAANAFRRLPGSLYWRAVFCLGLAALAAWLFWRWRAPGHRNLITPRDAESVNPQPEASDLRLLARAELERLSGSMNEEDWRRWRADVPDGGWWERRRMRAARRLVWSRAAGDATSLKPRSLRRFARALEHVHNAPRPETGVMARSSSAIQHENFGT